MIQHLGIIMDGNRRWANKNRKLAHLWHKAWFDTAIKISELAGKKWIKYLTLWALSTENLQNREEEELTGIIWLIELIPTLIPLFQKNKSHFQTIWDTSKLPQRTQKILSDVSEATKENSEKNLILALVYGWQDEIIRGIKNFIEKGEKPEDLSKENFRQYLDSGKYPTPDLIIRTGWKENIRHSWFLLYDSAYSEYYFSEKLWPEFDEQELSKAVDFFESTKRNFWK